MDSSNLMVQSQFRVYSSVLLRNKKKKLAYRNMFPQADNNKINIVSDVLIVAGIYQ